MDILLIVLAIVLFILILVLDDGRIADQGTHDELLERCAVYREIYDSQFKEVTAE